MDKGVTPSPTPRVVYEDITTKTVPVSNHQPSLNDVIMNPKDENRPTSFFAQPGILAGRRHIYIFFYVALCVAKNSLVVLAVIGGAVVGLLCAILVVMFIVYRMRKKDEGSYALDEPKRSPTSNSYSRGTSKEFYA